MARNTRLFQDPLACPYVFDGDTTVCATWVGWANLKLKHMLKSHPGSLSITFNPVPDVWIRVDTRPNRIAIKAGTKDAIYIAPVIFQIPNGFDTYGPYEKGPYNYWDCVVPGSAGFTAAIFPDIAWGQGYTNPLSNPAVYGPGIMHNLRQLARSGSSSPFRLDKVVTPTTDSSLSLRFDLGMAATSGARAYADLPYNVFAKNANNLSCVASIKAFNSTTEYQAILPSGDPRIGNFFPSGYLAYNSAMTANSPPTPADQGPPVAIGVYVGKIFYAYPSACTSPASGATPVTANPVGFNTAMRVYPTSVMTAVTVGHQSINIAPVQSIEGGGDMRLALSKLERPEVDEVVIDEFGVPQTHRLNSTLSTVASAYIDVSSGISSSKDVVLWAGFSPDGKFLYTAVLHTSSSAQYSPVGSLTFRVRRWYVFDGTSIVAPQVVGVYTAAISNGLASPNTEYDRIVGGFRLQVVDGRHVIGFMKSLFHVGGPGDPDTYKSDLRAVTVSVLADSEAPTLVDAIATETSLMGLTAYYGYAQGGSAGQSLIRNIVFADYAKEIFLYANIAFAENLVSNTLAQEKLTLKTPTSSAEIPNFAVFGNMNVSNVNLAVFPQGYDYTSSIIPPIFSHMEGNYFIEHEDKAYIQGATRRLSDNSFIGCILEIDLVSWNYRLIEFPEGSMYSSYIVTAPEK